MPNIKSAKKRVLVNAKKTEQNKAIRSAVKTEIKKIDLLIKEGKFDEITAMTKAAVQKVLGFELAHIGINTESEADALAVANLFSAAFGFAVIDNVPGHDVDSIREAIVKAKAIRKPVCIVCNTVKGKGFVPAENERRVHSMTLTYEDYLASCEYIDKTC